MTNFKKIGRLLGILLLTVAPSVAYPQDEPPHDDTDITNVEQELGKDDSGDIIGPVTTAPIKAPAVINYQEVAESKEAVDTIIIQKNYMPKTERFQVFGALTFAPNDVFYKTLGLQARLAYHLSERWGVEIIGITLSSSKSKELSDLEGQGVGAQALVSPRSYLGVDAYFNSVYGKAALYNRKIIPFEIYQTLGVGKMNTASYPNADAFHIGLGQLFSMSRSEALRVDLSVMVYQSKTINGDNQVSNTILLSVGYGRFFPEATYR
jgi:outer membrane beta-barrel protein